MLGTVAIIPAAPVLVPELAGAAADEVAELRAAMVAAVAALPPRWVVVGVGGADVVVGPESVGTFAGFGADLVARLSPQADGQPIELPPGAAPDRRPDVECLLAELPEPIDLDIDHRDGMLYWTDRGDDAHDGNTLNRARITASGLVDREVLARELKEGIGVSLDAQGRRVFVTDLGGNTIRPQLQDFGEVAFGVTVLVGYDAIFSCLAALRCNFWIICL